MRVIFKFISGMGDTIDILQMAGTANSMCCMWQREIRARA